MPATGLIEALLEQQQSLTAVEQFARAHDDGRTPAGARYYRDLIPVGPPGSGQQYAFDVDLDACSGCKACVAACHNLNGLDQTELWRNVGVLVGGTTELPVVQHVTTACHHCLEPACLDGCPVEAYEKDPITGIVRHLDDQCIGCKYCILKCPYDVPVYNKSRGIVRKCDMCHQRLAVGEAPACVQACPNRAIRIRIVSQAIVYEESEAQIFLPGAPDPTYTLPATTFRSQRSMPRNMLPADYFSVQQAQGHLPLVFMLVLTQMSVGAFGIEQLMFSWFAAFGEHHATGVHLWHLGAALILGTSGLLASIFHLGRPQYAYRALLGLRHSWLSREILAFGLFAVLSSLYVLCAFWDWFSSAEPTEWQLALGAIAAATGIVAVICSVMIYVDTRRPLWTLSPTTAKFLMTAFILGIPTALLVSLVIALLTEQLAPRVLMDQYGRTLCSAVLTLSLAKLLLEGSIFAHLRDRQYTSRRRAAMLLSQQLSIITMRRYFFGSVGGVFLPLLMVLEPTLVPRGFDPLFLAAATGLMLALLVVGELHERYLFFASSVAPRMPGGPAV